jgi:uncharacterized membrane protein YoaT (DUF817 family)
VDFLYLGFKEARAGLFGTLRYDLLLIALAIQAWMLAAHIETLDELKSICPFHALEISRLQLGVDE